MVTHNMVLQMERYFLQSVRMFNIMIYHKNYTNDLKYSFHL
jgi:hypothetical protein